jgi:hypothetical protein
VALVLSAVVDGALILALVKLGRDAISLPWDHGFEHLESKLAEAGREAL